MITLNDYFYLQKLHHLFSSQKFFSIETNLIDRNILLIENVLLIGQKLIQSTYLYRVRTND
jgi:hypothetical protein